MQISHLPHDPGPGREDWFTGSVQFAEVVAPAGASRLSVYHVQFAPGARTAWHSHPLGQVLYVTDGGGLVQRRGGPVEAIRAGDAVLAGAGEWHWHGAAAARGMTHLAVQEAGDGGRTAEWGSHVTDAEYSAGADG